MYIQHFIIDTSILYFDNKLIKGSFLILAM